MRIFNRPLGSYFSDVKTGLYLIAALAVIRFLMLPVFGVSYAQGTIFTSMSILVLILAVFYSYRASQNLATSYRDILGINLALVLSMEAIIAVAIAIDDFGGIETYFTDPEHSLANPILHMIGHLVPGTLLTTLVFWGVGSLLKVSFGGKSTDEAAIGKKATGVAITSGVILFVLGLISFILRGEITLKLVGRGQALQDVITGGGQTEGTITGIIVISSIAMVLGLILLINGIIRATRTK